MNTTFGEVAELYDAVRPDLPREVAGLVLSYADAAPRGAAEIGAGTGKATALFAGRGFPITCVEPDCCVVWIHAVVFSSYTPVGLCESKLPGFSLFWALFLSLSDEGITPP